MPPRRVIIATPVDAHSSLYIWYVNASNNCLREAARHGIELFPIYMANDILIQRARNDLIAIAVNADVDDIVWIDSDIEWQPEWLFKLLSYPVDVVGGTYRKKTDEQEQYTVRVAGNTIPIDKNTGLMEVDGLGTGFLRISKKALRALWENGGIPYSSNGKNGTWICEVVVENGEVVGEDTVMCNKLKKLGFQVYLDPTMTCIHVGIKRFEGNFVKFLETLK